MTNPNPGFNEKLTSGSETAAPVGDRAGPEPASRQGTEATPTPTPEPALDVTKIPLDAERYGKGKPRRVITRGMVIHDPGDAS